MKKSIMITLCIFLSLFLGTASAGEVTMFGPKQYIRTTGAPNVYTDTFSTIPGEAKLTVKNGNWDGSERITDAISSASVAVNGEEIFGTDDFNQGVYLLEAPINVAEGNSILVELASNPGSYLTIEVTQDIAPPTVTISAASESIHVNETSILSWGSTNADSATIDQGIGDVDVNGSITVSPTETKIYTITATNLGGPKTATATVTVVNSAPVADPQLATTDEDTAVLITLTGSDVDGDPLTYQVTTGPTNGTLTGTAPVLTYTPAADWYGTDTLTFTVNDGTVDSTPATVTITVNPVNDPPVAVDDSATTEEDTAVTTGNVLANDTDVDEDILSVSIFTQPTDGTAVYNGDGTFTYTPNANYNGTDSFTYTTDDGHGGSATATVAVTVAPINDAPVANAGPDQTVFRGDEALLDGSGSSDVDVVDPLTYQWSFLSLPAGSAATLSDSTQVNPTFVPDVSGAYEVQLIVNDGTADSVPDTAWITANPRIVQVPDVVGLAQADAEASITAAGLAVGTVTTAHSPTVLQGDVISQNPASGISVEENSLVAIVVSLGTALPTVTISADPESIIVGETATLTWTSTNAESATIDQGIGAVPVDGSITVSPVETTTYGITVTGPGGTATASVTVTATNPLPTVSITATPETILLGESSTLSWTSTNADSAVISDGIGSVPVTGSIMVTPTETTNYTIMMTGEGGATTASVTVTVNYPTPTVTISASADSINYGESTTLTWSSAHAHACIIEPDIGPVDNEGSLTVPPTRTTSYIITGSNPAGTATAATTVTVNLNIDLEAVNIDLSNTSVNGQTLEFTGTVNVEVVNKGTTPVEGSFEVTLFEDTNANELYDEAEDQIIGSTDITHAFMAGAALVFPVDVEANVLFKDNRIFAFVDSANAIQETDEENNITHSMADCEYQPPVGTFDPVLEWSWASSSVFSDSLNVMMTPAVIDLNDDGIPDVVFGSTSSRGGAYVEVGVLRAISGDSGTELFTVTDSSLYINTTSSIAAGDIDLDGKPEILACDASGARLIAFEHDGAFKWRSPALAAINWGAVALADMDLDGTPEIIIGRQVLNNDGSIRWTGSGGRGSQGVVGPLSFVADVDLDGRPEVVAGNTVYISSGDIYWQASLPDGYNAVANFDDDPFPEIVLVSGGAVWLLEHDGSVKWGPVYIPGGGRGGPPTVADFDNDDEVEIGVAGACRYAVFETNGSLKWAAVTQDQSSNLTGSSVFDFEGDGSAEVVYRDELKFRIYRGTDGDILFETPMSSCTWYEYVLVADVDNDGNAEIVAVANNNCGYGSQRGVYVFGDANDTWVNTRKIWNQYAYCITNVNDDGTIPQYPANNWEIYNNFRCNQSLDALACVDLTASYVRVDNSNLPDSMDVIARIGNGGALHVAPGLDVSFYNGDPQAGGTCLGTVIIGNRLNPGTYEDVTFHWTNPPEGLYEIYVVADDNGTGHGTVSEIYEDNNVASATFSLGNYTPTADAGADQTVIEGDSVFLDGSGSSDPEADPLTYQWSITSQPDGSAATLSDPSAVNPSFIADLAGTYIIQLIVSDGTMSSNIDTVKVTTMALVTVPDVVGMAQPSASSLITSTGLTLGSVTQVYSDTVASGEVISQDPEPQTIVLIGSAVDLVVSQGVYMVTVPDVTGLLQADAESAINTGELSVGSVTEEYIDTQPAGHVFQQDPPAGTLVPHDTTVDIAVSLGIWPGGGEGDEEPPLVSITVFPDQVYIGETVTLTVMASDNVGVVERSLTVNGTPLTLADEQAFYVATTASVFTAEASATDGVGLTSTVAVDFVVIEAPYDTTPPVVSLDEQDCIDVTDLYPITGSVFDENDFSYQLMAREKGTTEWVTFAEGTGSGAAITGELGVFDPTIRRNGVYEILLGAEDAAGNTASVYGCALVEGGLKVGQVEIPAADMSLPQLGFSLSLDRQYDSRSTGSGDFGPGWNLTASDVKAAATTTLGSGWAESISGDMFATYYLIEQYRHVVVIRLSDTDVLKFTTDVNPKSSILIPLENHTPLTVSYQPIDGTQASIKALDADSHVLLIENHLREPDLDVYNPTRFRVTRVDGTAYVISTQNGIESMTDVYGHTVDYDANGIYHSSGASISFERGAGNRIERITDPFGRQVEYYYDADGMLDTVVQSGELPYAARVLNSYANTTGVAGRPVLRAIMAPDGTELGQFEYDASGRMTALIDAEGNRIIYGYDVPNHHQEITDRLGNITLYEYDNKGNVTQKTDPLGNVYSWTYDERGNKLTEIDPLGNIRMYAYDDRDNLLSEADALGYITRYTYNDRNQVLSITDPNGNTTSNTYDGDGNLLTTTDPNGNTTTNTYDGDGNLISTTDCLGNTTTYEYDSCGNRTSEIDPLGNETLYTYDANGNELTKTTTRTTDTGPVNMIITNEYDNKNQLIRTIDPDGHETITEYNYIGKKSAQIDKNGNRTEYEYDGSGNLTVTRYPDGTTQVNNYDAESNRVATTDRAGRITTFGYDSLKRLVSTTYADSSTTQMQYDAAGRLIATIDENGNRTEFGYDAAGRRTSVTDALGNITTFAYDANGNQVSMTDAKGNTTEYVYDGLNRRIKTIYPDGTFSTVAYDVLGRKVSETDQAGDTTQFEYDAMGRLIAVTDALSHVTSYGYDEVGNKIYQTDPNGNTTYWAYDNLGRVVTHTLPLGMSESFTYDANGNMLTKTDFNGDTTTYVYDVCCGRLLNKIYPDAPEVSFTYTATGQRETVTDARGLTTYTYDLRDRVLSVLNPDGSILSYTYAATRNRTSVTTPVGTTTYTFDALNRLKTVTDPDGNITTYSYDAVGNRASIVYPNGTVTSYQYDTLNRLTYLGNRKSASEIISSYTYTLGPAGNRLQVVENTGRVVDYSYDTLYRLIQEDITDPVLGNETISYTYDAFGNRLTKTDSTGTIIYTYDVNDRLLTEVGPDFSYSYSYDDNGNTILKTDGVDSTDYAYDFENRLVSVQTGTSQVTYANDADGIRIKSTVDGVVTNFLVDKNRPYAQVLEETDDTSSLIVDYVYGDDLISQHRGGGDYFYLYDGQMSTRQLTNDIEDVANEYIYDAFGVILDQTGLVENNYRYTGEQYDPNAGFYYLRARYYNHNIGRFVTQDPWQGNVFEPVSLHKYLYANANPVMFRDPSGLWTLQDTMSTIAISATLASIMLPSSTGMPVYTGYVNLFDLQFGKGLSAGHILYGGFITAQITAYSKNKRHAWQGDFNVYMLGLGTGVSFSRFSDLIPFKTYTRTSIPDFEGFGRITTIEFAYVTPTFGIAVITLPNGKTIGPEEGIYAGYGWKMSGYVVLAYWDLKGIPRQIY